MAHTETIKSSRGINWTIRIVDHGDRYGLNDCLTHDKMDPLVEFYDQRSSQTERGQFVSSYYLTTLIDHDQRNGLNLHGAIPAWSLTADDMRQVNKITANYLKTMFLGME